MKIEITRHDLTRLLSSVTKVVESRNTIPILRNVAISVANGTLTVCGTDLDIEVSASAPTTGDTGAFTVDAKLLADIAKKAGEDIVLELMDGTLHIKSGKSRYRLPTLPVDDFPDLTSGEFTTEFEYDLAALVAPVAFAVEQKGSRPFLEGVYLVGDNEKLTAVATNGHRLAKHLGLSPAKFDGIIVPTKLVGLIPKGLVTVRLSDRKVQFESEDAIITGKLIDGTYPDFERVIPKGNTHALRVDRDTILAATERVSIVSDERGNVVRLGVSTDAINLSVNGSSRTAEDEVKAQCDAVVIIGFNSVYMGEVLRSFPAGDVVFHLEDGATPALVTGGNENLSIVLMPIRVTGATA